MNNIPGLTAGDNNIGSLRDILFVPVDIVTAISDPVDGLLPFDCLRNLSTAATVFKFEFTDGTGQFRYDEKKTANGPVFQIKISGMSPKDYSHRNLNFTEMQNDRFFVITRDNNNRSRLHGFINLQGEKFGLEFKTDFDTKAMPAGYNGFAFEFYLDSIIRPRPMQDISTITVDTGFPIDAGGGTGGYIDPDPPDEA